LNPHSLPKKHNGSPKELKMYQAKWNGHVIAESDKTVEVEGNQYFPMDSVNKEFLSDSTLKSTCPWKGEASYYNLEVAGQTNKDAVWIYRDPKERANQIAGHVAFWRGVEVTQS
jgi:uncharacterized protein (DUF427 family)